MLIIQIEDVDLFLFTLSPPFLVFLGLFCYNFSVFFLNSDESKLGCGDGALSANIFFNVYQKNPMPRWLLSRSWVIIFYRV